MRPSRRAAIVGTLVAVTMVPVGAWADGGHSHGDHEYQDADCTPADDALGPDSLRIVKEREHHGNGRTECVLVEDPTPQRWITRWICPQDTDNNDCYIAYDPYQEDTTEGNSNNDRGAAIRYHNGDESRPGEHEHGSYACWSKAGASALPGGEPTDEANRAEWDAAVAEMQATLNAVGNRWAGTNDGMARMVADGWWPYPVAAAKVLHMVRLGGSPGRVVSEDIEVFTSGMTDEGWQHLNAMFTLGNEGDEPVYGPGGTLLASADADGDGYVDNDVAADYKAVDEEHLPLWVSPTDPDSVCDLPWHVHTGYEGVATSLGDAEHVDQSSWMAHINLYAATGDPFGDERAADGSEPHAYWTPLHHVPALCNPSGPCL